jgi:hypothetical protein
LCADVRECSPRLGSDLGSLDTRVMHWSASASYRSPMYANIE